MRFSQSSASKFGGSKLPKKQSKLLVMDAKTQKIEPDPNFNFDGQKFRRQCVSAIDSNERLRLFFYVQTFRTRISDSVQRPLFINIFYIKLLYLLCNIFFLVAFFPPQVHPCTF